MSLRSTIVGIIEIDPAARDVFLLEPTTIANRRCDNRLAEFGDESAYAVVLTDVAQLREELESELWRLQARLAA
jgi:hypothetical protein